MLVLHTGYSESSHHPCFHHAIWHLNVFWMLCSGTPFLNLPTYNRAIAHWQLRRQYPYTLVDSTRMFERLYVHMASRAGGWLIILVMYTFNDPESIISRRPQKSIETDYIWDIVNITEGITNFINQGCNEVDWAHTAHQMLTPHHFHSGWSGNHLYGNLVAAVWL